MRLSSFYFIVSFMFFLASCASTTDKQSIFNTEADINYVESDADRAAREAQEEMDAQAAEQAELEAQAEEKD